MRARHETVHMSRAAGVIRTPDQRLRVFVSSTLKELAPERRAVRAAIERLAMAPVMFELGARPHPPRELYRAYLEQSDIFVGIYWEQYGWIAPGEWCMTNPRRFSPVSVFPSCVPDMTTTRRAGERGPSESRISRRYGVTAVRQRIAACPARLPRTRC